MFDVEVFIAAVKERPALYNAAAFHNGKDARTRLWDEIGEKMYSDWTSLDVREKNERVTTMQKRWKSLKDSFNREIRMQKTHDSRKHRKKYEFYDRLSFLHRTAPEVKIKLESPEPEIPVRTPPEGNPRKRKTGHDDDPTAKQILLGREDSGDDSDRLFLLSFVSDLRRLPFATKYWVRMMFSQIMHQAAKSLDVRQQDVDSLDPDVAESTILSQSVE